MSIELRIRGPTTDSGGGGPPARRGLARLVGGEARLRLPVVRFPPYIGHVAQPSGNGPFLITGCEVVLPDRVIRHGAVLADDGTILFAGPGDRLPRKLPNGCRRISAPGMRACPALWETHIHGCGGVSTESMTAQSLARMAKFLAQRGIGAFLPTIVSDERHIGSLGEALDSVRENPALRARIPGIHVEGPFVSRARRGAIPEKLVRPPSIEYLERMITLSRGTIRVLTIAPELPGSRELIDRLPSAGILPSLGHSDASYDSLRACEGISPLGVTHLFNGMSGVSHKEPGLAQWALLDKEVFTELNCDGTHVHDAAVRLVLQSRPWEKIVAISDAVAPAGLGPEDPVGRLYGQPLTARGAGLYYADSGVLVGSRLLVPDGLARLVHEFRVPVANAVAMATLNPARLLGFSRKGALLAGYDADVALFSQDFTRCSFLSWGGMPLFESP
ncbi:MAG: N-acetylglucosamine-6-phosphate deacetylase [Spirochaetia bacterium]